MAYGFTDPDDAQPFYDELLALIDKHRPKMAGPDGDELDEQIAEGFEPDAPEMYDGVILMVITKKLDGNWVRSWHSYMPGTGIWAARGMAADFEEWIASM